MLTLANPAGLWALLGLPVVLLIHFLQRKAVVIPVSTLFLLEKTQRESASGRRFDRLMNSVPLWMQLLGVILLAWVLAEPRYQKARSVQRIAVVLDSSASMSVSKDALAARLLAALPELKGLATEAHYTLLESTPGSTRLYAGSSATELAGALRDWNPRGGLTDPAPALRLARSLVSRDGIVVYGTDSPLDNPPFDSRVLSVASPVDNVGFTGVRFERKEGALVWQALVRNYSPQATERTWTLEDASGRRSEPAVIRLEPGAIATLQAAFPAGSPAARVALSPDAFALDDTLPLVPPQPKALRLFTATGEAFKGLVQRLVRALEAVEPVSDAAQADLTLVRYDPLDPLLPAGNAVVFVHDESRSGQYLRGGIIPERHPLIDGLNWQSLLVRETIELERQPADDVLLWQGERALVFLQKNAPAAGPAATRLCFNFDLGLSNAERLPAFAVLLHRFAESIRRNKVAPESAILETNQPVTIATLPGPDPPRLTATFTPVGSPAATKPLTSGSFPAPADPGFLQVKQGDTVLLDAAVCFGDTREADFSQCAPADTLAGTGGSALERHTEEDHWWRLWFILLLAALLVSWHFTRDRQQPRSPSPLPTPT